MIRELRKEQNPFTCKGQIAGTTGMNNGKNIGLNSEIMESFSEYM